MSDEEIIVVNFDGPDWAVIYLFGSRVRGDHKPDSDIDICVEWPNPTSQDINWWSTNNDEDFSTINDGLGGRIEILERNSPIRPIVLAAPVVHQDRNVRCVWLNHR
jgi:Nucleotidyltransferase domain